ncbi:glycoside hydrolase family 3 protein [Listeria seeligeri]|uniref:glycoside hydrolase family 3 protein n=1 Tax=Listeria seeligeri TaxID=1640 RepID=UPI0015E739EF|nr:glycoside hydrolase family 3 N-terminal domain-containing protein [Listeria seeligeri]MBF2665205.1 glycoside hydrolase family 3 C-terminal domain-containing protein [Listeria seeligeri]
MKKYTIIEKDGFILVENQNGATLGYSQNSSVELIEEDGYAFKDLNKNGKLDKYEDWRLPLEERVADLVGQMSIEDIAGLTLYSAHQALATTGVFGTMFAGTYDGKSLAESDKKISDLSDQQKEFLRDDRLRHVLLTIIEDLETAVTWNNNLQASAESLGLGIPVNICTDPRHTVSANTEFDAGAGGDISKWPHQLGLAATFSPELIKDFGEIAAKEYRALGIVTALSPQIDIATEPRWMRFSGTFGEDSRLSADLAKAYCEGFQNSANGWGQDSVNAMVKHWPGGGSGEAGRDAHFGFGKYAVYPGGNFDEHLIPFTEGAFNLEKTGKASAVMPYYTISYDQTNENVGNGYNKYLITDLLRKKYQYDGVVCTDWGITNDATKVDSFLVGKSWGVEELSIAERHYKILMAGVDQFGGNNDIKPVLEAYQLGVTEHGESWMRERFEQSAKRILQNIFQTGLMENAYLDLEKSRKQYGIQEYQEKGFLAQLRSIVMLKNTKNALPIAEKQKVYIPNRQRPIRSDWFGQPIAATDELPAVPEMINSYYQLVDTPEEADFALVMMESPKSAGYTVEDGYLPISLQYRPYTAKSARKESIAGGGPLEKESNRSYANKTNITENERDLDQLIMTKERMGSKPVIATLDSNNPTVPSEFEPYADAILVHFSSTTQALLEIISGKTEPSGLLPFQMPKNMETVETQQEDVPHDMIPYTDRENNHYNFGFGLNFSGEIEDERVKKYRRG